MEKLCNLSTKQKLKSKLVRAAMESWRFGGRSMFLLGDRLAATGGVAVMSS
jgi:hypothetical protein